MLDRRLEPEVMDDVSEAIAYDQMDHRSVNQQFVEDLLAHIDLGENASDVLDLGTGTAQIPILMCHRLAGAHVIAVDMSASMLQLADRNIDLAGLRSRIRTQQADAKQLPFEDRRFQVVMSNSIVHHVARPELVFREACRVTSGDGWLFFRDLLRPSNIDQLERLVETYAGDEGETAQQLFSDSLHAALTVEEVGHIVQQLGFGKNSVQQTSDRHWTWVVCLGKNI